MPDRLWLRKRIEHDRRLKLLAAVPPPVQSAPPPGVELRPEAGRK